MLACQRCQRRDALGPRLTNVANCRPQGTQPVYGELTTGMLLSRDVDCGERQRDVKKRPENYLTDLTLPIRESDWGDSLVNAQLAPWTEDLSSNSQHPYKI